MNKQFAKFLAIVCALVLIQALFSIAFARPYSFEPSSASNIVIAQAPSQSFHSAENALGRAYVTLSYYDWISVLDISTHAEVSIIPVGDFGCYTPWRATVSPNGAYVYVGCYGSGSVAVIQTAGNSFVTNVTGIPNADDVAFTRDGAFALVGSRWTNQVAVINTATYSLSYIPMPAHARSIAVHPFLDLAYVTSGNGTIQVVNTTTFNIIGSISVGGEPWDVAVSPDGQWVFASDRWGSGLHVIDANTHTVFTTVTGLGELTGLEVTPDGSKIYAASLGNGVRAINAHTFNLITTIPISGSPWEVAVSCDGSELYVGNVSSQVPVIDTGTDTLITQISTSGFGTRGIGICPQYVANGVFINPASQINQGAPGELVAHPATLINGTGATDSFELTFGGNNWDTSLSDSTIGPLAHGESFAFTVYVTVPVGTDWYLTDLVVVTATSVTSPTVYSDLAEFSTEAYAPPQIGVSPDALSSVQFVNEMISQTMSIMNGEGVTLTFSIYERDNGFIPALAPVAGHGEWIYRSETGLEVQNLQGETTVIYPSAYRWEPDEPVALLNILIYADDWIHPAPNTLIDQALQSLGLGYTAHYNYDIGGFEYNLLNDSWDMVLVGADNISLSTSTLGILNNYVLGGGKLIIHSQSINLNTSFWYTVGFGYSYTAYPAPPPVEWWETSHPVFNFPESVPELTSPNNIGDTAYAHYGGVLGGFEAIAGYTPSPVYDQAALIIGNDNRTVFKGFMDIQGGADLDGDAKIDAVELWINLINGLQTGFAEDVPWLSENPITGTLTTNSSQLIDVTFDSHGIQPGEYYADLLIRSNDPVSPTVTIPVTMTVEPTANMGWVEGYVTNAATGNPVEATLIAFGEPYTVHTNPATGSYKFWLDEGAYTLQVSASGYITQTAPVEITAQQGLTMNFALVLNVPVIEVSPDSLGVTHSVGDITMEVFTITNSGPASLLFEMEELNGSFIPLPLSINSPETGGGPDAFGYIFRDSNEPDGPAYEWEEIASTGTLVSGWFGFDDGYAGPLPMGFDFNYYGNVYTEFYIGTNGYLSFGQGDGTIPGGTLPSPFQPNNDIALFGSDLYLHNYGTESKVFYQVLSNPTRLVIEFVNIHYCCGYNIPHTFQTILYPDGDILVQYASLLGTDTSYVGIENENGTIGLGYGAALTDNLAICYAFPGNLPNCRRGEVPWLSTDPVSGTIPGYSSLPIQVTFDATGLQPGAYSADLVVQSNAPQTPNVIVPVTMTVQPTSNMGRVTGMVTDAWTGNPLSASVELVGVHTTTADPNYTIWADAGTYSILAYAPGYYTATAQVTINAGGQTLLNLALEPALPRMDVPSALTAIVPEGFAMDAALVIANTGPVPLTFSLHEINPTLSLSPSSPVDLTGKNILYDRAHGEESEWYFSTLIGALTSAGANVSYNDTYPITASILQNYDALWVNGGYTNWTFGELFAILNWLNDGGAVLVHGESYTSNRDVAGIYNIVYQYGYCTYYQTTTDILPHPVTYGIDEIFIQYSCNYLSAPQGSNVVLNDPWGQAHAVAHEENGGKMVVIAAWDFFNWNIYLEDNLAFGLNVFNWLASPAYTDVPWFSIAPAEGTIPGHSSMEITMGFDATDLTVGSYQAILAIEHNDPAQPLPVQIPVDLTVVAPQAGISLTPAALQASGLPGETVVYTLTLTNAGNIPDTFTLDVDSEWQAVLSAGTTPQLNPGESYVFTLSVTVPDHAGKGDTDTATVTAVSDFDETVTTSVQATTTAFLEIRRIFLPIVVR